MAAGVARERIWLDPGIGFGKHMTATTCRCWPASDRIVALGFPVLLGASRKSFIGALDGGAPRPTSGWAARSPRRWPGAAAGRRGRAGPRRARDGPGAAVWAAIAQAGRGG